MRAGSRNTKVTIEQREVAVDSYGDESGNWKPFVTVWASVVPQSGREFVNARAMNASLSLLLKTRHIDGVTPSMRVNNGGTYYNILSVFDGSTRKRELTLLCDEQI